MGLNVLRDRGVQQRGELSYNQGGHRRSLTPLEDVSWDVLKSPGFARVENEPCKHVPEIGRLQANRGWVRV